MLPPCLNAISPRSSTPSKERRRREIPLRELRGRCGGGRGGFDAVRNVSSLRRRRAEGRGAAESAGRGRGGSRYPFNVPALVLWAGTVWGFSSAAFYDRSVPYAAGGCLARVACGRCAESRPPVNFIHPRKQCLDLSLACRAPTRFGHEHAERGGGRERASERERERGGGVALTAVARPTHVLTPARAHARTCGARTSVRTLGRTHGRTDARAHAHTHTGQYDAAKAEAYYNKRLLPRPASLALPSRLAAYPRPPPLPLVASASARLHPSDTRPRC